MKKLCLLAIVLLSSPGLWAAATLDMIVVDTEGGKALLIVSPAGESMLIDAGFPGNNDRDALRIEEAAKAMGVKRFDYLVVTHYDLDHVNNVPATVARVPAVTFVDHGPAAVSDPGTTAAVKAYGEVVTKTSSNHRWTPMDTDGCRRRGTAKPWIPMAELRRSSPRDSASASVCIGG
jgi:beta-lactamase superfamily II metal-dependent hydrolase